MLAVVSPLLSVLVCNSFSIGWAYWRINLSQQSGKYQGDLLIDPSRPVNYIRSLFQSRKWPDGLIPYEIGHGYSYYDIYLIEAAMKRINQATCIRFFRRTNQKDYITIQNTNEGCYTAGIGKMGGPQKVSLQAGSGATCMFMDIILHELTHVIGFPHEHNRPDRDRYVRIRYENVMPGAIHQFSKVSPIFANSFNTPYDYSSILHYESNAFSKNGHSPTIEPVDKRFYHLIGKSTDLSYYDLLKISRMYNCPWNGDAHCQDSSPFCQQYFFHCRSWEVMWFYCQRTCGLCLNKPNA